MKPCIMSTLFFIEKLIKFVSRRMWNGGPNWVLYWRNIAEDKRGLQAKASSSGKSAENRDDSVGNC